MLSEISQNICKVSWKELREDISQIEPEFTSVVDEINPSEDYPLYILSFPYGQMVGDDLSQFIPSNIEGKFYRLNSDELPQDIERDLAYGKTSAPLGMVLNKTIEFYVDLPGKEQTIPIRVARAGEFYNFSRILSQDSDSKPYAPNGILKATAGARTVFSLPSLSCNTSFSRLEQEIGCLSHYPANQYEHHQLFKEICDNVGSGSKWRMQMMYFSESWIDSILNNSKWHKLRLYLFQLAWKNSEYKRNHNYFDISCSIMQQKGNCRTNFYLNDTARHLFDIAVAAYPGLAPIINDDLIPLKTVQHVLSYSYGLKKHVPTIMGPQYFEYKSNIPVYYSLQYPTTRVFSPQTQNSKSVLDHLQLLEKIVQRYSEEIIKKSSMWEGTILQEAVKSIKFESIHKDRKKKYLPLTPLLVAHRDSRFNYAEENATKNNKQAAINGNYLRGCISLTRDCSADLLV